MSLSLDIDDLLARVTYQAGLITGIRKAYDYDEWPDSPPFQPKQNEALHLTAYIEEEELRYMSDRGTDLTEWEIPVTMYTIVVPSGFVKRSRGWTSPFPERYASQFRTNLYLPQSGSYGITAGGAMYQGCRVVRSIPDWPGYDDFYMLRHRLLIHTKGTVTKSVGTL